MTRRPDLIIINQKKKKKKKRKRPRGLGSWGTGRDYPNGSITENGQNAEKSPGDLRRLAVTQTPVKNHQVILNNNNDSNNNNSINQLLLANSLKVSNIETHLIVLFDR